MLKELAVEKFEPTEAKWIHHDVNHLTTTGINHSHESNNHVNYWEFHPNVASLNSSDALLSRFNSSSHSSISLIVRPVLHWILNDTNVS